MTNMETTPETTDEAVNIATTEAAEVAATSTLEALLSSLSASSPFSKLLISIRRSVGVRLPNTALLELPTVLSSDTQERLIKLGKTRGIETAGEVILGSIDEINNGSLETVDKVIRKRLGVTETIKAAEESTETDRTASTDADTPLEPMTNAGSGAATN